MRNNQLETYELYGGDIILQFDKERHEYFNNEGELVPSTTKVIDEVIAKHALKFWAVKVTLDWLQKQLVPGTRITQPQVDGLISGGRTIHISESERAAGVGSNVHEWIEEFVKLCIKTKKTWPKGWKSKITTRLQSRDAINSVNAFLNWYDQNEVEFYESERKVYSITYNYSGTFDLLASVNDVITIVDFKSSKDIYPDYLVQGSAYWNALIEEFNYMRTVVDFGYCLPDPTQFMVLRLPKDGSDWETATINKIDSHFEIFKQARTIYDWINKDQNKINPIKQKSETKNKQYI